MVQVGLYVRLEARPDKGEELESFLKQGLELANAETTTPVWFAVKFSATSFAIFDAFADDSGRKAHLDGPIAAALMAKADDLLANPPSIEHFDVVGAKLP